MNVIVANKYQTLLSGLNIDVIKNLEGVFSVEELSEQFKNFYYNKMILDLTALKNYEDINTIQNLSVAVDMNKVILLLDDSPKVNSAVYLSQLVSMGIYNFTKSVDAVPFLIDNPNTYKDVASFHNLNLTQEDIEEADKQIKKGYGFIGQRVIGVKNLTEHAGSTTLSYMLKKHLEKKYKAKAVEIESFDFVYFNDKDLESVDKSELQNYIDRNKEAEVIIVDIGSKECSAEEICDDVIYLIEPGLIQLNRLIRRDNHIFESMKDKKAILNRSVLSSSDVNDFEKESGCKVFYNLPNIDDKLDNIKEINNLLIALGFTRFDESTGKSGFSLFH